MASVQWALQPKTFPDLVAGNTVLKLPVPARGKIDRLVLTHSAPAAVMIFSLYASESAAYQAAGIAVPATAKPLPPGAPYAAYCVSTPITTANGTYNATYDPELVYANCDGSVSLPIEQLWLVIDPGSAGSVTVSGVFSPSAQDN